MSDSKVCSKCREWKPLEAFNRNASKPLGRGSECRACQGDRDRAHLQVLRERAKSIELTPDYTKQCRRCGEWKSADNYSKDPTKGDGLQAYCKSCISGYHQQYQHGKGRNASASYFLDSAARTGRLVRPSYPYLTDTARMCMACRTWQPLDCFHVASHKIGGIDNSCKDCKAIRNADYRRENADTLRRASALYYANNKALHSAKYKEWRKHNKAYTQTYMRRWVNNNRDKIRANCARRRARVLGNGGSYTAAQWQAMVQWFGGICLCCGSTGPLAADHVIPVSKGGTSWISNIQPLCKSCNSSKQHRHSTDYRDPEQLRAFLAHIDNG